MIYLGLGSNLGDRRENLGLATELLGKISVDVQLAPLYETEPLGLKDQRKFLNTVVGIDTMVSPNNLLDYCHEIEGILGRIRTVRDGPRTIDVDILLYDNIILNDRNLVVPHPRMHERNFVLAPLSDIAANVIHPLFDYTVQELYDQCKDTGVVTKLF